MRKGVRLKRYEKLGLCQRKHSVNVIKKNLKEYFQEHASGEELEGLIKEALQECYQDKKSACDWAWCNK